MEHGYKGRECVEMENNQPLSCTSHFPLPRFMNDGQKAVIKDPQVRRLCWRDFTTYMRI
jgi:hypothetical protein